MKFKKTFLTCLLAVLCMICMLTVSFAHTGTVYTVKDAGITISIPDNMYVFTRDISPDDPRISEVGSSYSGMMSKFKSENIFLDAMNIDGFEEIVIISQAASEPNYYDIAVKDLYSVVEKQTSEVKASGKTVLGSDIYEHSEVDFVKIHSSDRDGICVEYITVYNGEKITIKYVNYDGEVTSQKEDEIESVIDSIKFMEPAIHATGGEPSGGNAQNDDLDKPDKSGESSAKSFLGDVTSVLRIAVVVLSVLVVILVLLLIFKRRRR